MKSNTELEFSDICVHYTFAIFTGTINDSAVLGRRAACLLSNSGFILRPTVYESSWKRISHSLDLRLPHPRPKYLRRARLRPCYV